MLKKTYMEARPTTNMRKGWLCRNSCDEKNQEIAPMMMIQQRWSRSRDDPDPKMFHIQWWSRSYDDDPDPVKMTWRWRWRELDDDPDDTEKKTCADKLCRENTLLVKRECWCNYKFRMYSLIYLMYCTPMFILGSFCNVIESCHAPMFWSGYSIM